MKTSSHEDALVEQIRNILLQDWDPVGIGDNSNLRDEYDAYIPELVRILNGPSANKEVQLYLRWIEIQQMDIPEDHERITISANRLVKLIDRSQQA